MRELNNWGPPDESLVRLAMIHHALEQTPALDAENRRLFARQQILKNQLSKEEIEAIKILYESK